MALSRQLFRRTVPLIQSSNLFVVSTSILTDFGTFKELKLWLTEAPDKVILIMVKKETVNAP
jgi:hypothetical protein